MHRQDDPISHAATVAGATLEKKRAVGELGCRRYCDEQGLIFARIVEVIRAQTPEAALTNRALVVARPPDEDVWILLD